MTFPDRKALADAFRRFAEIECRGSSPLYEQLSQAIAADDDMLSLAAHASRGQPAPNLLFAAAQFLLFQGQPSELVRFYPNLAATVERADQAFPAFREFCQQNQARMIHLLETRRVQTNEVRRCSYLLLAFSVVDRIAKGRPLALIEIGCSAGLNLMWDHYGYRYGQLGRFGESGSPVQLTCELRGGKLPPSPDRLPKVAYRTGIDINPLDVNDSDDVLWLRALVWPEHAERARLLDNAVEIAKQNPPRLVAGDGIDLLPDLLEELTGDLAVCVFHTHTLNQVSPAARGKLSERLSENAHSKDHLFHVSGEWLGRPYPMLELTAWEQGRRSHHILANCDPHGGWIEWLDGSDFDTVI